jgi:hypothetical protein
MIQYFPIVTGSLTVLGNINVSGSITTSGSITISGSITSASFASTASFVANAQTASYVLNAVSSSFASTASFVALAQSASNAVSAATASFANNLTVAGTLTAQTLVVQTITSSVDFVTGSTRFGSSLSTSTHQFTGSVSMNPGGLFVSSSGLVGIGTTAPTKALEILSNTSQDGIKISGASNPRLTIIDTTNNVQFDALTTDTEAVLRTDTNHPLHLSTNGTVRLTIAASGSATFSGSVRATSPNITAPSLGSGQGAFFASAANGLYGLYIGTSNDTGNSFIQNTRNDGTATAYALSIQPSGGNVGIGATDPVKTLDVRGTLAISNNASSYWYMDRSDDDGRFKILTDGNSEKFSIATTGTAIFSGSVGIGNVTPSAWASPFTVIQGGSHGQHIGFQSNGPDMKIGSNNYYNGSGYVYTVSSNGAAQFNIGGNSGFSFSTAPSGTAGNAVTFTTALYIPVGGSVYINNATTSNFINLESLLGNAGSAIISIAQTDSNKLAKATIIVQRSAYVSGVTYTVATLATQPIANYLTFGISGTYLTINTTGGAGTMAYNALVIPAY